MKRTLLALTLLSAVTLSAWAAVVYNQNIVAIFGSGNPNTGWTADTSNGITLALRAKSRLNGSTSNVNGTYTYATAPTPRGEWNYEFSINSGTDPLATYDYYLSTDGDPSQCINYSTVNPLTHWNDNSYGTSSTANGQGTEGTVVLSATNTIAQNSQNITFGDYPAGQQALMPNATYSYELYAVEKGAGPTGDRIASVGITVVVGAGGAPCNTPANADACKDGGWMTTTRGDGSTFKNQGDCMQYVNTGR